MPCRNELLALRLGQRPRQLIIIGTTTTTTTTILMRGLFYLSLFYPYARSILSYSILMRGLSSTTSLLRARNTQATGRP